MYAGSEMHVNEPGDIPFARSSYRGDSKELCMLIFNVITAYF